MRIDEFNLHDLGGQLPSQHGLKAPRLPLSDEPPPGHLVLGMVVLNDSMKDGVERFPFCDSPGGNNRGSARLDLGQALEWELVPYFIDLNTGKFITLELLASMLGVIVGSLLDGSRIECIRLARQQLVFTGWGEDAATWLQIDRPLSVETLEL